MRGGEWIVYDWSQLYRHVIVYIQNTVMLHLRSYVQFAQIRMHCLIKV